MSFDPIIEEVPDFVRRVGDNVIQGSNNTLIVLGTDRAKAGPAKLADGLGHTGASEKGKGTGTIHLVAGRKESDPNLTDDLSYIYVSMKTDIDRNMKLDGIEGKVQSGPSVGVKADHVRIYSRKDTKVTAGDKVYLYMTTDDMIVLQANKIRLGKDAKEKVIKGSTYRDAESQTNNKLKGYFNGLQTALTTAATAAVGPLAVLKPGLQAAASLCGQISSAIQTFENDAPKYLSEVSTTL